jgi:hypothetical protein
MNPIKILRFPFNILVVVHSLVYSVRVLCQTLFVTYLNNCQQETT